MSGAQAFARSQQYSKLSLLLINGRGVLNARRMPRSKRLISHKCERTRTTPDTEFRPENRNPCHRMVIVWNLHSERGWAEQYGCRSLRSKEVFLSTCAFNAWNYPVKCPCVADAYPKCANMNVSFNTIQLKFATLRRTCKIYASATVSACCW